MIEGGPDEARALALAVRDHPPADVVGAAAVATSTGVLVLALNRAGTTGLNTSTPVRQLLDGCGGGAGTTQGGASRAIGWTAR
ncbi:hypothetical protein [Streptomyces sp. NPDC101150]|uniref:hypothetical protein n=1 Tax=Streptomyces sp. NPDC101150 TaxID=3366114 RepID=UPI00381DD56C